MAAPAFGSAGTQLQGSAATMNVDVPDGVVAGSFVVVTAFVDTAGGSITGLAGDFVHFPDSPVEGENHQLCVMWHRATGTESTAGTYDFTLSGSVYRNAQAIRYDGVITTGDPFDVTNGASSGAGNVSASPDVADTTTVADTLGVHSATNWSGGSWTPASGFTERRDTGDGVCTVGDKTFAAPGATGTISATSTSTDKSVAHFVALKSEVAATESSAYSPARLPGRIGPDGNIFTPGTRFDDSAVAAVTAAAGEATGTGTANQPAAHVQANAGVAAATGAANQPTVSTVTATNAPAGLAAATGTANAPAIALGPVAGVAAGTGTANTGTAGLGACPGAAAATGTANPATISTVTQTNAPAGLAAATGTAFAPSIAVQALTAVAAATGTANQPAGLVGARAGATTGAGTANAPTVLTGGLAFAGVASGTGVANGPTTAIGAHSGLALVTGTAPGAAGQGDLPVERISDPLTLTAVVGGQYLGAVTDPLTLEALEDE